MRSLILVSFGGFGVYTAINIYKGNQSFYKNYVVPLAHLLDPESAHRLAVFAGKHRLLPKSSYADPDVLVNLVILFNIICDEAILCLENQIIQ